MGVVSLLILWAFSLPSFADTTLLETLARPEIEAELNQITHSKPTLNHLTLLRTGEASFDARVELIRKAENFVFTEMPFWTPDEMGLAILHEYEKRRGRRGVEPDLWTLFDLTTTFFFVSGPKVYNVLKEFDNSWIQLWDVRQDIRERAPSQIHHVVHNRMHEKIFIVDGWAGVIGGMNYGDDYFKGGKNPGSWQDTDLLIEGPAVHELTRIFLKNFFLQDYLNGLYESPWRPSELTFSEQIEALKNYYLYNNKNRQMKRMPFDLEKKLNTKLLSRVYFPEKQFDVERPLYRTRIVHENSIVKVGVDPQRRYVSSTMRNTLEFLISKSQKNIKAMIPYLTFTQEMRELLMAAAKRGVRVEIVTNSKESIDTSVLSYYSAAGNYLPLVQAGVKLYLWKAHHFANQAVGRGCNIPFVFWPEKTIHNKIMVIDDEIAIVGSHNFNYRSEYHNMEVFALIEDEGFAKETSRILDENTNRAPYSRFPFVHCMSGVERFPLRTELITLEKAKKIYKENQEDIDLWHSFPELF